MKSAPPPSVVFAVWVLLFAQNTRAASSVTAFDGTWSVTINAHEYKNADGTVSLAWVRHFPAKVKNGILHGEAETIVLEDKYRVILTTPDVQIPAEYTISREALRKKVFAFRDAIDSRRPEAEIKALANELYQILFGPIAKNIESYSATPRQPLPPRQKHCARRNWICSYKPMANILTHFIGPLL